MKRHLALLGLKVRDVVSGFEGVAESVCFDLYGCVQAVVRPEIGKDAKINEFPDGRYFDVKRLKALSDTPVMAVPNFALPEIGAADKPALSSSPVR
jgi:hypothetical protein